MSLPRENSRRWAILWALWTHQGPMRSRGIARHVDGTTVQVSRALGHLETAGLVRVADDSHGQEFLWALTPMAVQRIKRRLRGASRSVVSAYRSR